MLNMISHFVQIKLQEILALKYSRRVMNADKHMIQIAGEISTQRSYADLITVVREMLPIYFEFEGVAILFRDTKTN